MDQEDGDEGGTMETEMRFPMQLVANLKQLDVDCRTHKHKSVCESIHSRNERNCIG